jgi:Flp pilus assembly protein TadD
MLPWEVKLSMGELRMLKGEYSEAENCLLSAQEEAKGSSLAKERQVRVEEIWGRCYAL